MAAAGTEKEGCPLFCRQSAIGGNKKPALGGGSKKTGQFYFVCRLTGKHFH
jgi:hypothetical protein